MLSLIVILPPSTDYLNYVFYVGIGIFLGVFATEYATYRIVKKVQRYEKLLSDLLGLNMNKVDKMSAEEKRDWINKKVQGLVTGVVNDSRFQEFFSLVDDVKKIATSTEAKDFFNTATTLLKELSSKQTVKVAIELPDKPKVEVSKE